MTPTRPDAILMNNHTQIDVDMARTPANGVFARKLRAVGNFVAEEPTPPVRRAPLPDSEQPDAVKRRKLVQERPRPPDRCPSCEANTDSLAVIAERLAEAVREIERLRSLLQ